MGLQKYFSIAVAEPAVLEHFKSLEMKLSVCPGFWPNLQLELAIVCAVCRFRWYFEDPTVIFRIFGQKYSSNSDSVTQKGCRMSARLQISVKLVGKKQQRCGGRTSAPKRRKTAAVS